jgi:ethanolamine utilization cobalamin adenosyltransferase
MIAEFKFGYTGITEDINETIDGKQVFKERKLTIPRGDYDSLRKLLPNLPLDPIKDRPSPWEHHVADIDAVLQYVDNIEIIKPIRRVSGYEGVLDLADKVINKLHNLDKMNEQLFNRKVEVHVPGNELLKINDVRLLQDSCTDEVQRYLNDGWRILSICPQPDQRRPDYIMGRESE